MQLIAVVLVLHMPEPSARNSIYKTYLIIGVLTVAAIVVRNADEQRPHMTGYMGAALLGIYSAKLYLDSRKRASITIHNKNNTPMLAVAWHN